QPGAAELWASADDAPATSTAMADADASRAAVVRVPLRLRCSGAGMRVDPVLAMAMLHMSDCLGAVAMSDAARRRWQRASCATNPSPERTRLRARLTVRWRRAAVRPCRILYRAGYNAATTAAQSRHRGSVDLPWP